MGTLKLKGNKLIPKVKGDAYARKITWVGCVEAGRVFFRVMQQHICASVHSGSNGNKVTVKNRSIIEKKNVFTTNSEGRRNGKELENK